MATEQQIAEGIRRADAAGDTEGVRLLGAEWRRMQQQKPGLPTPKKPLNTAALRSGDARTALDKGRAELDRRTKGYTPAQRAKAEALYNANPDISAIGQASQQRPTLLGSLGDSAAAVGGAMFRSGLAPLPDLIAAGGEAVTDTIGGLLGFEKRKRPGFRLGDIPDKLGTPRPMNDGIELAAGLLGGLAAPGPRAPSVAQQTTQRTMAAIPRATLSKPGLNTAVVEAGARQNVPIRQPDAIPALRGAMAKAEASPYGGPKVAATMQNDKGIVMSALAKAGGGGTVQDEAYNLGNQIQGVGAKYIARSRRAKDTLYDDAEKLAGGQRVVPNRAVAEIDSNIAELEAAGANTNGAVISYLKGLKADMAKPGGFSIGEFQGLRSGARKAIKGDQGLTVSDADRRLAGVVKAFTDDAAEQLPEGAGAALAKADKFYAARQDFIGGVLREFMGKRHAPLNPEAAASRFMALTKNRANYDKLARFWKEANPDEQADFAATAAETFAKGRNGEFSLGALATNVNKMPRNIRVLMFGPDGTAAMDDLALIARAKSDTAGGLNTSRSGVVMAGLIGGRIASTATAGSLVGGTTGMVVIPLVTEAVTALGQRRAAKLLLNPDFTKALRAYQTNGAAGPFKAKLNTIAANNPAIASELAVITQYMNGNNQPAEAGR